MATARRCVGHGVSARPGRWPHPVGRRAAGGYGGTGGERVSGKKARGRGPGPDLLNFRCMKYSIGILGATGLTGAELVRLLLRHPGVDIAWLSSGSQAGTSYAAVYPGVGARVPAAVRTMISMDEARRTAPDAVFSCLPHAASAEAIEP